jgi:hypothetical protein
MWNETASPRILVLDEMTESEGAEQIYSFMNFMNSQGIYS